MVFGMPLKIDTSTSRQAQHLERTRARLIQAAHSALAEFGDAASVANIADHAHVSIATLYNHFENKEALFREASQVALHTWEAEMGRRTATITDEVEALVASLRLFGRLTTEHPLLAPILVSVMSEFMSAPVAMVDDLSNRVRGLSERGILPLDDIDTRVGGLVTMLVKGVADQIADPTLPVQSIDRVLEIALSLFGFSPDDARRLTRLPLPAPEQH
jgi:AcrR family transcriptional regulator